VDTLSLNPPYIVGTIWHFCEAKERENIGLASYLIGIIRATTIIVNLAM